MSPILYTPSGRNVAFRYAHPFPRHPCARYISEAVDMYPEMRKPCSSVPKE